MEKQYQNWLDSELGQIAQKEADPDSLRLAFMAGYMVANGAAADMINTALTAPIEEYEDLHFKPLMTEDFVGLRRAGGGR